MSQQSQIFILLVLMLGTKIDFTSSSRSNLIALEGITRPSSPILPDFRVRRPTISEAQLKPRATLEQPLEQEPLPQITKANEERRISSSANQSLDDQSPYSIPTEYYSNYKEDPHLADPSKPFSYFLRLIGEGVLSTIFIVFGLFGNSVAVYLISKKKLDLQPYLRKLMIALSTYDSLFLISAFFLISLPMLSPSYDYNLKNLLTPLILTPLCQISLTGSVYTILAINMERYISVCHPHAPSRNRPSIYIATFLFLILFPFVYNLGRFFELKSHVIKVEPDPGTTSDPLVDGHPQYRYKMVSTWLRNHPIYLGLYLVCGNGLLMVILPVIALAIMNYKIRQVIVKRAEARAALAQRIAKAQNQGIGTNKPLRGPPPEPTIGSILLLIVVFFVISQSFKLILTSAEFIHWALYGTLTDYTPFKESVIILNHTCIILNASVNIVFYIWKDKGFRAAFIELFPSTRRLLPCFRDAVASTETPTSSTGKQTPHASNGSTPKAPTKTEGRSPLIPKRDVVITVNDESQLIQVQQISLPDLVHVGNLSKVSSANVDSNALPNCRLIES